VALVMTRPKMQLRPLAALPHTNACDRAVVVRSQTCKRRWCGVALVMTRTRMQLRPLAALPHTNACNRAGCATEQYVQQSSM
jgi:hypothetical protein